MRRRPDWISRLLIGALIGSWLAFVVLVIVLADDGRDRPVPVTIIAPAPDPLYGPGTCHPTDCYPYRNERTP